MSQFAIPASLQEVLNENRALAGLVDTSISEFGAWLGRNNTKFFAEYTDHSLEHVQEVLKTANDLIRNECRAMIKSGDVAALVLAALLHDCAMHLSIDGFINLVQSDDYLIEGFSDKPWNVLWLDFLAESRRFSGRKLMALFGDTEPVRHPPMSPQEMTGKDLLLCGEFLRRHHHRLAHEIALFGVPGPGENKLQLKGTEDTEHIIDLAGVIARSHGLSIRDCFDYLQTHYSNVKVVRGLHPVYIMALLRIADILQIRSERAPRQIQQVDQLQSPVSVAEWEMHQAIKDINFHDSPEVVLVVAEPKNVKTYLAVRKLLDRIQYELDRAWTVIGEIYGSDDSLRHFGLKIRRIHSNIDDLEQFSKRVPYIPTQASFEVADTDLLKLLIAPLYGEKPEIGIRELLQNAIDAVRELKEYRKQRSDLTNVDLPDQDGDVLISIDQDEEGKWWVAISDKGIGMTVDTVREYFLKAGASLRRSEIWKKTFEDEQGKSRVLRSGRFGVGALAAFLLGDQIYISTRHVTDQTGEGIEFQCQLDTEAIELRRIKRPLGTTIRVQISDEIKETLEKKPNSWNWYFLDEPIVVRQIAGEILERDKPLPNIHAELSPSWRRIRHADYQDIQWSYDHKGLIVCNGIIVRKRLLYDEIYGGEDAEEINFDVPLLSVFDFDAHLPINLQRTELTSKELPFNEEIRDDILRDFIAYILVNAPEQSIMNINTYPWYFSYHYLGTRFTSEKILFLTQGTNTSLWYSTELGLGIYIASNISRVKVRSTFIVSSYTRRHSEDDHPDYLTKIKTGPEQIVMCRRIAQFKGLQDKIQRLNDLLAFCVARDALRDEFFWMRNIRPVDRDLFYNPGVRILVSRNAIGALKAAEAHVEYSGFYPFWSQKNINLNEEWSNKDWVLWQIGDCGPMKFDFIKFAEETGTPNDDEWPCVLAEWYFADEKPNIKESRLSEIWMDLLGSPIIPYDMAERRRQFASAYKELKPYIKAHEAVKNTHSKDNKGSSDQEMVLDFE